MKLTGFILKTSANYKALLTGMLICTLVISLDNIFRPYIIKLCIDNSHHFNITTFAILACLYLSSQIFSVISSALFDWFGTLYHTSYRENIAHTYLDRLTKYDYNFFQETQAGTITARITDAFNSIPVIVFISMSMFLQLGFLVALASIIVIKMSYLFGVIMLLWITFFVVMTKGHIAKASIQNKEYAQCRPKIFGFLTDYFSNIINVWFFLILKMKRID